MQFDNFFSVISTKKKREKVKADKLSFVHQHISMITLCDISSLRYVMRISSLILYYYAKIEFWACLNL